MLVFRGIKVEATQLVKYMVRRTGTLEVLAAMGLSSSNRNHHFLFLDPSCKQRATKIGGYCECIFRHVPMWFASLNYCIIVLTNYSTFFAIKTCIPSLSEIAAIWTAFVKGGLSRWTEWILGLACKNARSNQGFIRPKRYNPRNLTVRPWKMMGGRWSFPFGSKPIFRGYPPGN